MIPCRALLFDMDGLMVDSEPLWFEVEREFARARGGDWTEELARACIGQGMASTLRVMHAISASRWTWSATRSPSMELFIGRVGQLR